MMRTAISPRLAMRTLENMDRRQISGFAVGACLDAEEGGGTVAGRVGNVGGEAYGDQCALAWPA